MNPADGTDGVGIRDSPMTNLVTWSQRFGLRAWRQGYVFLMLVLVVVVFSRLGTLHQPLLEAHDFRQTQTAYTSLLFHQNGVDLFASELPVLGEPWQVPFEFPIFQASAAAVMSWGVSPDMAMRITGLAWFTLTAVLIWALTKHVTRNSFAAGAALVAFAFSPFSLLWSRTSMIEFAATAGAVGWAYTAIRWMDTRRIGWAAMSLLAGSIGMLTKAPTAGFWVVPIFAWALVTRRMDPDPTNGNSESRHRVRSRLWPWLTAIVATPIVLGLLWTRNADAIKAASEFTAWLTTDSLQSWNFGTLDQRFQPANWLVISNWADPLVLGRWFGIPLALAGLASGRPRALWLAVALAGVLPILVFFNLYVVHDYYLCAVTPAAAMLLGQGAAWVHQHWRRVIPAAVSGLIIAGVWLGVSLLTTKAYWSQAQSDPSVADRLPIATELAQLSTRHERVALLGLDWSPATLYYSQRRGMMFKGNFESTRTADELAARRYEIFAILDPYSSGLELATAWQWVGAVGPHTYRVGNSPSEVAPAQILGTTDVAAYEEARARGAVMDDGSVAVTCGSPLELTVTETEAIWLRVSSEVSPELRVLAAYSPAPLPVTPVIVLTAPPGAVVTIDCVGSGPLIISGVVAAPFADSGE